MIKEYLSIEGNATQNLTTFCQTYMEPMATKIMAETCLLYTSRCV